MKNGMKFQWIVCVIFILLLNGFITQNVSAKVMDEEEPIPLDGSWKEGQKSLSPTASIEVTINGSLLSIQSRTECSNITIRISKSCVVVYEETVPALVTQYIQIDLSGIESDTYHLELTNQWGDYLYGDFWIE